MIKYEDMNKVFWDNFEYWIDYYRKNVHRFIAEYFGINLKTFQKILVYQMASPDVEGVTTFDFFASRGLGKTWLTMVFACAMAVLYPGIKIAVASASVEAANIFLKKIEPLYDNFPNLAREIEDFSFTKDNGIVSFMNTSEMFVKACNERARGERAQITIFDERNIMDTKIIDDVFLPYLTELRDIPAYAKPEYKKYVGQDHNCQIYLTSVGHKNDDSFIEFEKFYNYMVNGDLSYTALSIPYQIGVKEGIIDKSLLVSQAKKQSTSIEGFRREYEAIPSGSNEDSIFNIIEINRAKQVVVPLIEPTLSQYVECKGELHELPTYVNKEHGELRVLSVDIATAMGRLNDASAWSLFRLYDKGDYYDKVLAFHNAENGMNIDAQVLYTKRLWHYFDIDYIVFDAGGMGGINFANLLGNLTIDMQLGRTYPGMKTMNRKTKFDIRVTDREAIPILYPVQVSGVGASQVQSDMAFVSKVNFERNRIFLLMGQEIAIDELDRRYKFLKLRTSNDFNNKQITDNMISSFLNTEELIREMLSVKFKRLPSGRYTMDEGGKRKDRLISLLYGCYFIHQLEEDLSVTHNDYDVSDYFSESGGSNYAVNKRNPFGGRMGKNTSFWNRRR